MEILIFYGEEKEKNKSVSCAGIIYQMSPRPQIELIACAHATLTYLQYALRGYLGFTLSDLWYILPAHDTINQNGPCGC